MTPARLKKLIINAGVEFGRDQGMAQAAAVAYYTALSFAPLVLLLVTIGGLLGEDTQGALVRLFSGQIGPQAAGVVEEVTRTAHQSESQGAWWRWVVSVGTLLFTSSVVFAQLQASLNRVWDVRVSPGHAVWGWIRKRLLSIGMIVAILFILLVGLVISSVVEQLIPGGTIAGRIGVFGLSLVIDVLLFAAIYKILPDVRIAWRDVWVGAAVTGGLFAVGQVAISLYLQYGHVGRDYGNAISSLITLLVWVYYSAVIFFFGAEITQQYARMSGRRLTPDKYAQPRDQAAAQPA